MSTSLSDLLYDLRGVAIREQDRLGTAHQEIVYHRALEAALRRAGFRVRSKPAISVRDAFGRVIQRYQPDLLVSRDGLTVLVEVKADPNGLQVAHRRQVQAYLSVLPKVSVALLINFARRDPARKNVVESATIWHKRS